MSIALDSILDKFILIAREALSGQLSSIGPSNDIPAVIRTRQKDGITPNYPYVVLDVLAIDDFGNWLQSEYLDQNNDTAYDTYKYVLLNFRVYGGNALNIANNLHGFFRLDRVLGDIRSTLSGAVAYLDGIESTPIRLSDKYLESASFNLTFVTIDTFIDTSGSNYFDTVDLTVGVKRNEEDEDPLVINIIESSN